uniref:Endoplasmic reticulum transmembrane protein n=1 Tax=Kalanchoe fedtschenkoi TaxID=63787 RepID=A0A7N0U4A1_KALFE
MLTCCKWTKSFKVLPALLRFKTKVLNLVPCLLWIKFCGGLICWRLCLCLTGFTLFLGFLIDRVHHYLQKLQTLRSSTGALKDEIRKLEEERARHKTEEDKSSKQVKVLEKQVSALTAKLKKLELESAEKDEKIKTAEVHVASLQKQAADLLLEYDRLLEDNQLLQNQGCQG